MQFLTFCFLPYFHVNLLDSRFNLLLFTKESPFNKRDIVNNNEQIEGITFLLACYNESETVRDTLSNVLSLNYAKGNYYHQ